MTLTVARCVAIVLFSILILNRLQAPDFFFNRASVFSGTKIYNPYATPTSTWVKANFHAHARSYGGLTNGKQFGREVVKAYLDSGYRIAGVSDYFRLNPETNLYNNLAVPVFEHGLNHIKAHQLIIGAQQATFEDIVLFQNDHTRQHVLNELSKLNGFICIAHPKNRNGHSEQTLKKLIGYQAIEIFNGPHKAVDHWDAALSSGSPIWGMANDDIHDIYESRFAESFNYVPADVNNAGDVRSILDSGSFIAVHRLKHLKDTAAKPPLPINTLTVDSTVAVTFDKPFNECRVVGQEGKILATFSNSSQVRFTFRKSDTYLRLEIKTKAFEIYMNPFFRYSEGEKILKPITADIDHSSTSQTRILLISLWILVCLLLTPAPDSPLTFRKSLFHFLLDLPWTYRKHLWN